MFKITPHLAAMAHEARRQRQSFEERLVALQKARTAREKAIQLVRSGAAAPLVMDTLAQRMTGSEVRS